MKALDFLILAGVPLAATFLSVTFKTNFFVSTFLFYGTIGVYFSARRPQGIKRALVFSVLISIIAFFVGDYIASRDGSWFVPTIFPVRWLGVAAFEDLFWAFVGSYAVVIFYEHFLDRARHRVIGRRLFYFAFLIAIILGGMLVFHYLDSVVLQVRYAYLLLGIFGILLPILLFLGDHPRFVANFLKVGAYFAVVNFLHEISSLQNDLWTFPGKHFVGWVTFLDYKFPFEELFFFILLAGVMVLAFLEYFDDDRHVRG